MLISPQIGSSMKSVGEVMSIGRNFEEAFQKAFRMVDESVIGFDPYLEPSNEEELSEPTDKRMFVLAAALKSNISIDKLYSLTKIDRWFLYRMANIIRVQNILESYKVQTLPIELLRQSKQLGFCDKQIASFIECTELMVRKMREDNGIRPYNKQIDTLAAEHPAQTNYLYLTYNATAHDLADPSEYIMVIGSGVYRIGSSVEFDWCAVGCIKELRRLKKKTIMVNCNPETVSTDYDIPDRLYFEEISFEVVMDIYNSENPEGVILSMGGQLPNNIAMDLYRQNARILGTSPESIDGAENRYKFSRQRHLLWIVCNMENVDPLGIHTGESIVVAPSQTLTNREYNRLRTTATKVIRHFGVVGECNIQYAVSPYNEDYYIIEVNARLSRSSALASKATGYPLAYVAAKLGLGVALPDITNSVTGTTPACFEPSLDYCVVKMPRWDLNKFTRVSTKLFPQGPFNMQLIAKDNELKVIECNVRVSRSFPFVSKTLDLDFVAMATRVIVGEVVEPVEVLYGKSKVGVKVPQFSFSRLTGADVTLGVGMASTGEVACFGDNIYEAYLKAIIASSGFTIPTKAVLLSVGGIKQKEELLDSVRVLEKLAAKMGFKIYASSGTADFYSVKGIRGIEVVEHEWRFENIGEEDAHVCHVARKEEIMLIKNVKAMGVPVTCEVCPHHLFLTKKDLEVIGEDKGQVRPMLVSEEDRQALWDNMDVIDCFATDHAPHTLAEKTSANPPPGYPGLETVLPLLLTAVSEGRLSMNDLVAKFHSNPKRIFNLPEQYNTYIEVDLEKHWEIPAAPKFSKAQWTPFAGRKVVGAVHRVVLRGQVAYIDGQVFAPPGYGNDVREWKAPVIKNPPLLSIAQDFPRPPSTLDYFTPLSPTPEQHAPEVFVELADGHPHHPPPRPIQTNMDELYIPLPQHPHPGYSHGLNARHILEVAMFNRDQIRELFNVARALKRFKHKGHILEDKVMASVFYEVSTRTSCSFNVAMQRLGGRVVHIDESSSSVKKGETLQGKHCEFYPLFLNLMGSPYILDRLQTVFNRLQTRLLTLYDVKLNYVSPPNLGMPESIQEFVASKGKQQEVYESLEQVLPVTDVLYMTRIRKERGNTTR
ncbi:CAD protein-like [Diaphorina citri]|uniref:carbamoyl-phosphate synthase (ammonia) n=1 Tax=Diaphorina citri TaxID=121845 RepID=A0A3Q0IUT5_DIACI|nr:CAD protein-like [Diaphorina citri]